MAQIKPKIKPHPRATSWPEIAADHDNLIACLSQTPTMTPVALICDFCFVWQDLRHDELRKGVIILNLHSTIFMILWVLCASILHRHAQANGKWNVLRSLWGGVDTSLLHCRVGSSFQLMAMLSQLS